MKTSKLSRILSSEWFHFLLLWILLALQTVNMIPTGNEEMYFSLAKKFYSPEWLGYSVDFTEFQGTRVIFQYITAHLLNWMSFEQLSFWGRLISLPLMLFPLNKVFGYFRLKLLQKLLIIACFMYLNQAFFGGGWIFGGFEVKTLSYILLFFSLWSLLEKKYWNTFILAALATYMHILVGGWFSLGIGLYLLFRGEPLKKLALYASLWALIVLPFVLYLASKIVVDSQTVINGINLDYVYAYIRVPHHCGIFEPWDIFLKDRLPRIVFMAFCMVASIFLPLKNDYQKNARSLFLVFSGLALFSVLVGYFDKTGAFLKFYPFRTAVWSLLFFLIMAVSWGFEWKIVRKFNMVVNILALTFVLILSYKVIKANFDIINRGALNGNQKELYQFVREHSQKDEVFLFLGQNDLGDPDFRFERLTHRDRYFTYKYIASGGEKIYDWYVRYINHLAVSGDHSLLNDFLHENEVDYVVSDDTLHSDVLILLGEAGEKYIYKYSQ